MSIEVETYFIPITEQNYMKSILLNLLLLYSPNISFSSRHRIGIEVGVFVHTFIETVS